MNDPEAYETLDDECPICGGEGFVFECFDGFCEDADIGCDDCERPCECKSGRVGSKRLFEKNAEVRE